MEDRRRQKWNNNGRWRNNKRPPRVSWYPTVPSWEKEFCQVVGALQWETLLHAKKFVHLYDNVMKWNDSAGEEAFHNAKKRYWAEINGLPCDISLPDPDAYIDKIDWDSKIDPDLLADLESNTVNPNPEENREPVIIFGDSLIPNQEFSEMGWGENEEALKVQGPNSHFANHGYQWEQNWGDPINYGPSNFNYGPPNFNHGPATGWPDFSNNAWDYSHGGGYVPWGGGWNYANYNNNFHYGVGPKISEDKRGKQEHAAWNASRVNSGQYSSNYRTSRAQGNDHYHRSRDDVRRNSSKERDSFNSCGPTGIRGGQNWNREKPVS